MSHTPGPWSVKQDGRLAILIQEDETGYEIASVWHGKGEVDSTSNAALILSAPDLYESLTDLLAIVADCHGLYGPEVEKAQRVISEAEGHRYSDAAWGEVVRRTRRAAETEGK